MTNQGGVANQLPCPKRRSETVLIVDDNPDHATLAAASLERRGWQKVDTASTLAAAFETTRTRKYDLLLIDYCLPDGFGLDLIDWVRHDSAVVVMTGMGSEEVAAEAIKSGAVDYLVKNTIFPDVLPDIASRAVERFRVRPRTQARQPSGRKRLQIKTPRPAERVSQSRLAYLNDRLVQVVSRIRGPLAKMLADGPTAPAETQANRLKTALANCDEIVELIKQHPSRRRS